MACKLTGKFKQNAMLGRSVLEQEKYLSVLLQRLTLDAILYNIAAEALGRANKQHIKFVNSNCVEQRGASRD